jgi:hypothetical protein
VSGVAGVGAIVFFGPKVEGCLCFAYRFVEWTVEPGKPDVILTDGVSPCVEVAFKLNRFLE